MLFYIVYQQINNYADMVGGTDIYQFRLLTITLPSFVALNIPVSEIAKCIYDLGVFIVALQEVHLQCLPC